MISLSFGNIVFWLLQLGALWFAGQGIIHSAGSPLVHLLELIFFVGGQLASWVVIGGMDHQLRNKT